MPTAYGYAASPMPAAYGYAAGLLARLSRNILRLYALNTPGFIS